MTLCDWLIMGLNVGVPGEMVRGKTKSTSFLYALQLILREGLQSLLREARMPGLAVIADFAARHTMANRGDVSMLIDRFRIKWRATF